MADWTPMYERWRHGGWYVTNLHYPSGAVGCVSRNYPDHKWRIACDPRPDGYAHTYPNRDAAARAEYALVQQLKAPKRTPAIPYTPDDWTPEQAELHRAADLEQAFHHASCLAGGWYHGPVAIDYQITEDRDERYMLRPVEAAPLAGWTPVYEVKRLEPPCA